MLILLAAIAKNDLYGLEGGKLPWHCKEDLDQLYSICNTTTNVIIVGEKTYKELPKVMKDKIKNLIIFNRATAAQTLLDITNKRYNYYVIGGKRTIEFFLKSKKIDRFKITYIKDSCLTEKNETSPIFFPELGEILSTQTKFTSHSSSQCYIGEGSLTY